MCIRDRLSTPESASGQRSTSLRSTPVKTLYCTCLLYTSPSALAEVDLGHRLQEHPGADCQHLTSAPLNTDLVQDTDPSLALKTWRVLESEGASHSWLVRALQPATGTYGTAEFAALIFCQALSFQRQICIAKGKFPSLAGSSA